MKKKELKSIPLYNSILKIDTEFDNYREKCNINKGKNSDSPREYTYLTWKKSIKDKLKEEKPNNLENYMHYLIHLKRIEESLNHVPTSIFGFLFGGACIKIFEEPITGFKAKDTGINEYEIITGKALCESFSILLIFMLLLIVFIFVDMYFIYRSNLWIWFYDDVINIVQEVLDDQNPNIQ